MRISVSKTKTKAIHFVYLARRESIDLDLFFDKNVSAAPDMAPDRPELLPDWSKTIEIMAKAEINCMIVRASGNINIPFNGYRFACRQPVYLSRNFCIIVEIMLSYNSSFYKDFSLKHSQWRDFQCTLIRTPTTTTNNSI